MRYVFYREEDLKLVGMSDCELSMNLPFIQVKDNLFSLENMELVREKKELKLRIKKEASSEKDFKKMSKIRSKYASSKQKNNT